MKNLRVNSKTKINEFKRKHNWLVESSAIKLNVSNIKSLSNEDIEKLNCGDIVLKEDVSGKHAYLVSFKNETGMCLTYCDASVIETQSYDKINGQWVYNSEDKSGNLIEDVKPIYCHPIRIFNQTGEGSPRYMLTCLIFNNDPNPMTITTFKKFIDDLPTNAAVMCSGYYKDSSVEITSLSYISKTSGTYLFDGGKYNQTNYSRKQFEWNSVFGFDTVNFIDGVNKIN